MQKNLTKRLRIFAGPNGSGKSTLFEAFSKRYRTGCFINADHIENHHQSYLFDNSGETLTLIAEIQEDSSLILHVEMKKLPNWLYKYVLKYYL